MGVGGRGGGPAPKKRRCWADGDGCWTWLFGTGRPGIFANCRAGPGIEVVGVVRDREGGLIANGLHSLQHQQILAFCLHVASKRLWGCGLAGVPRRDGWEGGGGRVFWMGLGA